MIRVIVNDLVYTWLICWLMCVLNWLVKFIAAPLPRYGLVV